MQSVQFSEQLINNNESQVSHFAGDMLVRRLSMSAKAFSQVNDSRAAPATLVRMSAESSILLNSSSSTALVTAVSTSAKTLTQLNTCRAALSERWMSAEPLTQLSRSRAAPVRRGLTREGADVRSHPNRPGQLSGFLGSCCHLLQALALCCCCPSNLHRNYPLPSSYQTSQTVYEMCDLRFLNMCHPPEMQKTA